MSRYPGYRAVDSDGDILMADAHPDDRFRLGGFDRVFTATPISLRPRSRGPWQRRAQPPSSTNHFRNESNGSERHPPTPSSPSPQQTFATSPFGNHLRYLPLPLPSRMLPQMFSPQTLPRGTSADAEAPSLPPLASIISNPYGGEGLEQGPRQDAPLLRESRVPEVVDLTGSPLSPRAHHRLLPMPDAFPRQSAPSFFSALHPRQTTPQVLPPPGNSANQDRLLRPIRPQTPPHGYDRPPPALAPKVACTACLEDFKREILLQLACNCYYCTPCLNLSFKAGCVNMASFPPKCCGKPLRISIWGSMLESDTLDRYKKIEAEFSANRPLYCASPKCSTFISEEDVLSGEEVGICQKCSNSTCRRCRRLMNDHAVWQIENRVCPKEEEDVVKLYELGNEKRWKQCPSCCNMVEKTDGCNHMDCVCGVEFCYRCGKLFDEDDSCECEPNTWGEDEEEDEEDEEDNEDDDDEGEEEESDEEWPDFRVAVDPAGRPKCLHPSMDPLGGTPFTCHGCLEMDVLSTCEDCALELCQTCVDNVRNSATSDGNNDDDLMGGVSFEAESEIVEYTSLRSMLARPRTLNMPR